MLRALGAGGMGEVYCAHDDALDRDIALKVLPESLTADPTPRARLLREARAAATLSHPHICTVFEVGEASGHVYIAMELVDGRPLSDLTAGSPLPVESLMRYGAQIADALAHAHDRGVIHRDLKTANVVITPDGRAKVLDFGLARRRGEEARHTLTEAGAIVGTPAYLAPEVIRGEKADERSDLWALGIVLYEMASGTPPFTGRTSYELAFAVMNDAPARLPSRFAALGVVITRCLAKQPGERYQRASEVQAALDAIRSALSTEPVSVTTGSSRQGEPMHQTARSREEVLRRRNVALIWTGTVAGVVLLGLAAWSIRSHLVKPPEMRSVPKGSILVADFEGPSSDPELASAARDLVCAALDQSGIVATVPSDQIKDALHDAGKPESTPITADLARELSYRRSVRAVLEGRVSRVGTAYSTVLRVVDPETGGQILTVSDVAHDQRGLVQSLERMARQLRRGLGEREGAIRATRPLIEAATPSFDAYRKYLRAVQLNDSGDIRGAVTLHRDALAVDPDFAAAWGGLGVAFANLGLEDSAAVFYTQALRRPNRLTDAQRLGLESALANHRGDLDGALTLYDRLLLENITPAQAASAYLHRGHLLGRMGRWQEAFESVQRSRSLWPFGPPMKPVIADMEFSVLVASGHPAAADTVARRLRGEHRTTSVLTAAVAAHRWDAAESLATALASDRGVSTEGRWGGLVALAYAQASRGAFGLAGGSLARARAMAESARDLRLMDGAWWGQLVLSLSAGVAPPPPPTGLRGASTIGSVDWGLWAAAVGDTNAAEQYLRLARRRPMERSVVPGITLLEGWTENASGRWNRVVAVFEPALAAAESLDAPGSEERPAMLWQLAGAFEHLGDLRSAAAAYNRLLSPQGGYGEPTLSRTLLTLPARCRLVDIHSRLDQLDEAEREWAAVSHEATQPDRRTLTLLRDARQALTAAEKRARSANR